MGTLLFLSSNTSAYDFSVTIPEGEILEVKLFNSDGTTMGSTTSMNVSPSSLSSAGFNEKNVIVSVATSNEWGYNLIMNIPNTNLVSKEDSSNTIPTLAPKDGGYTCTTQTAATCDFTVNHWGYKINTNTTTQTATNYLPIPTTINLNSLDTVTTGDTTSISFGSRINASQAPGTYQSTITFAVTANPDPTPIMQNMTTSTLATLLPTSGSTATLKDSRDGNRYQITNINGTYWMTDNLKIMGTISAADSNFTGADFNISAGGDLTAGNTLTEPRAHFNTSDPNSSTYGAYYNYCAASAGTVCSDSAQQDATSDICPKGWRLPTQTEITTIKNNNGTNFNLVLAGYYIHGSLTAGSRGNWWSATAESAGYQYQLYYSDSSWNVGRSINTFGRSMRCVYDIPTMQRATSEKLTRLIPNNGDTISLKDERDNTTYTVGRLADGKVWMLDNLALDLTNSTTLNNTTASNTNASDASITSLKSGNRTAGNKYATAGVSNWTSGTSYSAPLVNATNKDTTQPLAMGQSGTGKVGVYYNFCAASAGSYCYGNGTGYGSPSGNATEDICPKGWRMPTGGSSGEYKALYTAYSSNNANFVNALKTPFSGTFKSGSAVNQGSYGYFWSSTYYNTANMYSLNVLVSYILPQNYNDRNLGSSIRCLFSS